MLNYRSVIDKVMDIGLTRINNNPDMNVSEIFKEAANGEHRTVRIVVYDDPPTEYNPREIKEYFRTSDKILWDQGLGERSGKVIKVNIAKFTVTYKITVTAWFRLIAQQNTFRDLYWSDQFDAEGDWFFRDLVVWDKFWNAYKDLVKLNVLEKMLLKQKDVN